MRAPRSEFSLASLQSEIVMPLRRMAPASIRPLRGSRPMTDCAIVVLPEPDSPTSATNSPGRTSNDKSCTTCWRLSPLA